MKAWGLRMKLSADSPVWKNGTVMYATQVSANAAKDELRRIFDLTGFFAIIEVLCIDLSSHLKQ